MVARGRGCSCENEGGGTGGAVLQGTRVAAPEGAVLVRTRVVAREEAALVRTGVVARERGCSCENECGCTGGGVLVGTRVLAREGLFLRSRGWWHGRGLFL